MNAAVAKFNQAQVTTSSDNIINVTVKHVTSGGSQQAILDGKSQPTVWSPGDGSGLIRPTSPGKIAPGDL